MKVRRRELACGFVAAVVVAASCQATTVVIDDDFGDGTVSGWQSMGNGRTFSAHNLTESGSTLTSEVVPTQSDTHRGIVSTASFNPSAESGGFTMTFVVSSQGPPAPGANGFFIGVVTENSDLAFFRDGPTGALGEVGSFGLSFFGHIDRTQSANGLGLAVGDNNGTLPADFILDGRPNSVDLASFQDGFTASMTADPEGWSYLVTGLSDTGGVPTTFSGSGTWAAAGTDFASVFGGDTSWYALGSNQGPGSSAGLPTHTVVFDRITVTTIPEPSCGLLVLGCLAVIARRRRP